jgi:ubiquinone/menaquinone biosynthesis C-methylase UbiE
MNRLTPKQIYNELSEVYDRSYGSRIHELEDEYIYSYLAEHGFTKGRLLDLGSGTGSILNHLRIRKEEYTGIDVSDKMIEISRKKFPGYNFVIATMTNLPFEDESFDNVISLFGSFSYAYKPDKAVKELDRVLKPNGKFLIMACGKKYKYRESYILNKFDIESPARFFSRDDLKDLFFGFRNVKIFSMTWLSEKLSKILPYKLARLYHNIETRYLSRFIPEQFYFHIITGQKNA